MSTETIVYKLHTTSQWYLAEETQNRMEWNDLSQDFTNHATALTPVANYGH